MDECGFPSNLLYDNKKANLAANLKGSIRTKIPLKPPNIETAVMEEEAAAYFPWQGEALPNAFPDSAS